MVINNLGGRQYTSKLMAKLAIPAVVGSGSEFAL